MIELLALKKNRLTRPWLLIIAVNDSTSESSSTAIGPNKMIPAMLIVAEVETVVSRAYMLIEVASASTINIARIPRPA
jgi:hypothetical protein